MSQPPVSRPPIGAYPPPGYPPPVSPYAAAYRSPTGLGLAALGVASLVLVLEIVEAVVSWQAGGAYAEAARAHRSADSVYTAYDLVGLLWLPALGAAYVVSCLWLWRARRNAEETLSPRPHTRSRGWVWGGWVAPVVSLWFPLEVVRDVRDATAAPGRQGNALLGWWWAFWLLELMLTQVGSRLTPISGVPDEGAALALGPVETANVAVAAVAFTLWCLVVRRISAEQDAAARSLAWHARP